MRYFGGMTGTEYGLWLIGTLLCGVMFIVYGAALYWNSVGLIYLALVPGLPGAVCHLTVFALRLERWLRR